MTTPNFVPLNLEQHKDLKLSNDSAFSHAAKAHMASVVIPEFAQIASCMPIFLIQTPEENHYELVAMLGLQTGENLYYRESGWQGHAIPMSLQQYPFDFAIQGEQMMMLLDENSDRLNAENGEPLLSPEGELMPALKGRQQLMTELAKGKMINDRFIEELTQRELITPVTIELTYQNGDKQKVQGCLSIDEKKFNELDKDDIYALHKNGGYSAITSMLLSIRQLNRLVQLSQGSSKPLAMVNIQAN